VRGHWAIESMHWHLDVTFREDGNRTIEKRAAENMNIIRKWALSILKMLDVGQKRSLKKKRFTISCDFEGMVEQLLGL
jgi:predicted transposase YbfD/YdcC